MIATPETVTRPPRVINQVRVSWRNIIPKRTPKTGIRSVKGMVLLVVYLGTKRYHKPCPKMPTTIPI